MQDKNYLSEPIYSSVISDLQVITPAKAKIDLAQWLNRPFEEDVGEKLNPYLIQGVLF